MSNKRGEWIARRGQAGAGAAIERVLDLQPQPGETWLLVTSASHMPRSVGVFRQIGWEVVPWPVDHRTAGWWGVDRWLLPMLGTPWSPGHSAEVQPQMASD